LGILDQGKNAFNWNPKYATGLEIRLNSIFVVFYGCYQWQRFNEAVSNFQQNKQFVQLLDLFKYFLKSILPTEGARIERSKEHLPKILSIAILAVLSGADGWWQ